MRDNTTPKGSLPCPWYEDGKHRGCADAHGMEDPGPAPSVLGEGTDALCSCRRTLKDEGGMEELVAYVRRRMAEVSAEGGIYDNGFWCVDDAGHAFGVDAESFAELAGRAEAARAAPGAGDAPTDALRWLDHAIACCDAWEPQVRIIGNVPAKALGDMLRSLRAAGAGDAGLRSGLLALAKEWEDEANRRIRNAAHRPVWEAHGLKTGASFERAHAASLRALASPPGAPAPRCPNGDPGCQCQAPIDPAPVAPAADAGEISDALDMLDEAIKEEGSRFDPHEAGALLINARRALSALLGAPDAKGGGK